MKFRLLLSVLISSMVVVVGHIFYYHSLRAIAQESHRWQVGDTLWFELDSLPALPSYEEYLRDSLHYLLMLPIHERNELQVEFSPSQKSLPRIEFNYSIPYWSVYRRSVTVWGITFSAGQISPYALYPAGAHQDATVLSFPLQPPR